MSNREADNQQTDKMCELVELYALNGLSEEEAAEFREHLTTCADCRNQLIELQLVIDLLPEASEPVDVPQGMRERVLGQILGQAVGTVELSESVALAKTSETVRTLEIVQKSEHKLVAKGSVKTPDEAVGAEDGTSDSVGWRSDRSGLQQKQQKQQDDHSIMPSLLGRRVSRPDKKDRKARYWKVISLGLSGVVIGLGLYTYMLKGAMDSIQSELFAANGVLNGVLNGVQTELNATKEKLAVAAKPADGLQVNTIVALNPTAENFISKGLASIVIDNKGTHLIVQAEDLPQVKQQEAFQVWLIKDNQPVSAGILAPQNGKGVIYFTFEPKDYDTVAITLEPDANGVKPRGTIVLTGGLKS